MQQTQNNPSYDTNSDEQSFMHRITTALTKSGTKIAMVTGATAGYVGGATIRRRILQSILGAVVPLLAFAILDG